MKDPIEFFFPGKYYRDIPRTLTTYYLNDDLIAAEKRMIPMAFEDFTNKYKGLTLAREYLKFAVDNKLYTPEMERAYNHLKFWNTMSYLAIPFGMFIGAAVINPIYTGRGSRLVRKIVVGISGTYFFVLAHNVKESWKYNYYVKFWDFYPPHVREYLKSKDHRYLLLFDVNNSPYKLFDEKTKKSLF